MATSLDDTTKSRNASERGRGRGRGRSQGRGCGFGRGQGSSFGARTRGMHRQGPLGFSTRPSPYTIAKTVNRVKNTVWRHDLFNDSMVAAGLTGAEVGTKLYISNLDYGVSNEDIKELFSEVGDLKRCAVHYDRNGHPTGSAEVVYARRTNALAAFKRYNNAQLDGKPMKIEEIGPNVNLPVSAQVNVVGAANRRGRRTVVMSPKVGQGGSGSFGRMSGGDHGGGAYCGRGRGRGGFHGKGGGWGRGKGGGWGRGRNQLVEKSAAELDKELETYHAEAMNTS